MEWNEFPETKSDVDYSLLQRSFNIRYENQVKNEQSRQDRLLKSYRARQAASMMRDEENRKYKIQMQAEASSSLKDPFTSQNMDKDGDSFGFESFYGAFNTTPFSSSCDSGVTNGLEMQKWILYSVRYNQTSSCISLYFCIFLTFSFYSHMHLPFPLHTSSFLFFSVHFSPSLLSSPISSSDGRS
mmetsp:Transcript_9457/g.17729  ORF Transcript_9457/g.17729 Transcript_9457/m.17729 type:complete len:185 (-) Transcript_9457:323-877(-)